MYLHLRSPGPPITETTKIDGIPLLSKTTNNSNSVTRKDVATGPFIMETPRLSTYNQQLWVIAVLRTENTDGKYIILIKLYLNQSMFILHKIELKGYSNFRGNNR